MDKFWFSKGSLLGYFGNCMHLQRRPLQHLEISEWRNFIALGGTHTHTIFQVGPGTRDLLWPWLTHILGAWLRITGEWCVYMGVSRGSWFTVGWHLRSHLSWWAAGSPASVTQVHFLVLASRACSPGPEVHWAEDACMGQSWDARHTIFALFPSPFISCNSHLVLRFLFLFL